MNAPIGTPVLSPLVEVENRAWLSRVTCGWKKPHLAWEAVRRYWRDVHSPAIARRDGIYEYRHSQFDRVRTDLFAPIGGVEFACDDLARLMWVSDVRYADEPGLKAFGASPEASVLPSILGDIEMIVERSTTYRVTGENGRTLRDLTDDPAPQGNPPLPSYAVFFRQKSEEGAFRDHLRALAARWASVEGVARVRLSLFDVPDMEAELKAGYPVKTHPAQQQYQAWIDLILVDDAVAAGLFRPENARVHAAHIATVHTYPVLALYTFNYRGRVTLAGLRGYPAYEAIQALGAEHQKDARLLEWMYGAAA